MAFVPNRRNRPVADSAIAETPVATGQTNDNPYAFDDADVEADYATAEEFRTYDDPDSVQDILRDKPEQFYVGTVERSKPIPKVRRKSVSFDDMRLNSGLALTICPFAGRLHGFFLCADSGGSNMMIAIYESLGTTEEMIYQRRSTGGLIEVTFPKPVPFTYLSTRMLWTTPDQTIPGNALFVYEQDVSE